MKDFCFLLVWGWITALTTLPSVFSDTHLRGLAVNEGGISGGANLFRNTRSTLQNGTNDENDAALDGGFAVSGNPNPSHLPPLNQEFLSQNPCPGQKACEAVHEAIDSSPQANSLFMNIPGTCQNWAREFIRANSNVTSMSAGRIRQRYALSVFYCEFYGGWVSDFVGSWGTDAHECEWHMKSAANSSWLDEWNPCNDNDEYQILRTQPGQLLIGTLPPELSMISSMREVSLSDNLLSGTIPDEFVKLSLLETINLSTNTLTVSIPNFVFEFERLTSLDLSFNQLSGTLSDGLDFKVPNLSKLDVSNNHVQGTLPASLAKLSLLELRLDNNELTGLIPRFQEVANMTDLCLENNRLSGTLPLFYPMAKELAQMRLHGNNLVGSLDNVCALFSTGSLEVLTADVSDSKVICTCCSDPS